MDWNAAAKKPGEPLSGRARELREETRRALLIAFAPTMVLNDWAESVSPGNARPSSTCPPCTPSRRLASRSGWRRRSRSARVVAHHLAGHAQHQSRDELFLLSKHWLRTVEHAQPTTIG